MTKQYQEAYYNGAQTITEYLQKKEKTIGWCKGCIRVALLCQGENCGAKEEFPKSFTNLERAYKAAKSSEELISVLQNFRREIMEE